ncbi:hypothetical protein [Ottowia thiooxydans]|uniref:Uncharacterized protein n=1 Tax=Ottowia thiooxydans TaxID=219182 RepID=A0ABV2Q4T1_9BURK
MNNSVNSNSFKPISISCQDLADSKAAVERGLDRDHVGNVFNRVFDKIVDWFSGTNHAEAKRCLFDLCSPDSTGTQKYTAFKTLQSLTGESYKKNFFIDDGYSDGTRVCTLNIDIGGMIERFQVDKDEIFFEDIEPEINIDRIETLFEEIAKEALKTDKAKFSADLTRTAVTVFDGGKENGVYTSAKNLVSQLEKLGYSGNHIKLIARFCSEKTEKIVLLTGVNDYKIALMQGEHDPGTQVYAVESLDQGLQIRLSSRCNAGVGYSLQEVCTTAREFQENDQYSSQTPGEVTKTFLRWSMETTLFFPLGETRPRVTVAMTLGEFVGPGADMPVQLHAEGPVAYHRDPRLLG